MICSISHRVPALGWAPTLHHHQNQYPAHKASERGQSHRIPECVRKDIDHHTEKGNMYRTVCQCTSTLCCNGVKHPDKVRLPSTHRRGQGNLALFPDSQMHLPPALERSPFFHFSHCLQSSDMISPFPWQVEEVMQGWRP